MSEKFSVSVNDSYNFELTKEDLSSIDAIKVSNDKYHIIQTSKSFNAEITDSNFYKKTYQIKINNTTYSITILNQLDLLIKDMGFEIGMGKKINSITAPMPGLILEMNVSINQEVKENDTLLILEAMKMENIIASPRNGIIKSILVAKGDAVEKNQLLIEFE